MTTFDQQPPQSRRAARMLERDSVAHASGETPTVDAGAPAPRTDETARAIVSDAIFAQASWARTGEVPRWSEEAAAQAPAAEPATPSPAAAPAAEQPPLRRRDRRQPAESLAWATGEAPTFTVTSPVDAPQSSPTTEPAPPPASSFAAPAPGAAPSWLTPAPSAPGAAAPAAAAPPELIEPPLEHTLTRRELRALRGDSGEPEAASTRPAEAVLPPEPVVPAAAVLPDEAVQAPEATAPLTAEPTQRPATAPTWSAPDGHWTRQIDAVADDDDPLETTFSRQVGAGAATTSALVLPDLPTMDLAGPLGATGEIMLTGSIRLPDSLASTGADEHVDLRDELSEIDDERGIELPANSQPIRAIATVTGQHALGSPIVSTVKPGRSNKVLTGLLVAACSLAVIVTGLIITAFALRMI